MKAFTERRPRVLGAVAVAIMAVVVIGIIFLNRNIFNSGYQVSARFSTTAGIGSGTDVLVAGVQVGTVTGVKIDGNAVDATMSINHGIVLPHHTLASVQVETLLGVVDVALQPVSGWSSPLRSGALDHRHVGARGVLPSPEHRRPSPDPDQCQGAQQHHRVPGHHHPGQAAAGGPDHQGPGCVDHHRGPAQRGGQPADRLGQHRVEHPGRPGPTAGVRARQLEHGDRRVGQPERGPGQPHRPTSTRWPPRPTAWWVRTGHSSTRCCRTSIRCWAWCPTTRWT